MPNAMATLYRQRLIREIVASSKVLTVTLKAVPKLKAKCYTASCYDKGA